MLDVLEVDERQQKCAKELQVEWLAVDQVE